jgi:hypothetical protein
MLYTNFYIKTNIRSDSVMHVCPLFFAANTDQPHEVLHELGRYYANLGETGTGTWHDPAIWDTLVGSLCKNAKAIRARG